MESATWETYSKTKDPNLKQQLILEYATLVKFVAGRLSVHIGSHVDYDDLVSYGIFGLIDAIDKFDYEKGVKFETYASLRIRGAIIDNIRKLDWVPRTLRQKNKLLEKAYRDLEVELGREPNENELSEKLNMTLEQTQDLIKKASVISLISLDDYLDQNHEAEFAGPGANRKDSPEALYEKQEIKNMLKEAIDKLSEKERKVISLYYFEDLTLKEISKIMEVSESRISQIHSKAVLRLQAKLDKYKNILFAN
jgi:RNA polymerase sigma factor for flagellar operon FliA